MANEYLRRTPTSTGNRRVFTWSGWVKLNNNSGSLLFTASPTKDNVNLLRVLSGGQIEFFDRQGSDASTEQVRYTPLLRDYGSWTHILINADTTQIDAANRVRVFVNGVELSRDATNTLLNNSAAVDTPPRNQEFWRLNGSGYAHYIGAFLDNSLNTTDKTQYTDVFFVDGQALTPDVFGFYKQGKGYISAGSTQATDFRPGQWVPKTPRVIKTEINRRGGFGVNGFYLPMNDSKNFGADFHCDPNSIITLNEKLPQPRVGVATTASVGLGYTDVLRADPYAANLVLALPGISTSTAPNLITNGTFDTSVSGWTTVTSTITWSSGRALLNRTGGAGLVAYQAITTVIGQRYTLSGTIDSTGTGGRGDIRAYSDLGSTILANAPGTISTVVNVNTSFTATTTTTYIYFIIDNSGTAYFDDIVVRQEDAPKDYSAFIKGSGTNKTITANGNAGVGYNIPSYYGSSLSFDGNGDYLTIPSSSDFSFGTGDFTVEFWMKRLDSGTNVGLLDTRATNLDGNGWFIRFTASTSINFTDNAISYATLTHSSDWNHIAFVRKSSVLTGYVNGVAAGISTNATKNFTSSNFLMGGFVDAQASPNGYNGYIQDLRIYKGVAKYAGGFDVPRPYTPVGIATWRAVPDTTVNNFATLNPLIEARPSSGTDSPASSSIVTFAGGNLDLTNSGSSGNAQRMYSFGTIGISTGRWYWEVRAGSNDAVAISKGFQQKNYGSNLGSGSGIEASVGYYGGGSVSIANTAYYSTATTLTPPTFDTTNIIGIAVSANSGLNNLTVQWFKDGIGVSTVTGIGATSPVLEWFPSRLVSSSGSGGDTKYNFGQNPTFSGNTTAGTFTDSNGKGLFKYQPPSGFLALCEDNLPTPAISDPGKHFKTVLYTGSDLARSVVGVGFTPDLVWIKARNLGGSTAYSHNLYDSVRPTGSLLASNETSAEVSYSNAGLSAMNSDGFSIIGAGSLSNSSSANYVAWCWRAGAGTTSTNTNGSITSVVSVNQDAGFSIVSYTGTGVNAAVGHGLGKVPKFIMIKNRTSSDGWINYHSSIGPTGFLQLNTTGATSTLSTVFNNTSPTSNVFSVGTVSNTNGSGINLIAYCWAEIEGFSKAFSYVGNGSADGPFTFLNFKPALIIIKRTDNVGNWQIYDSSRMSTNPNNGVLFPNLSNVEGVGSAYDIDFLSNGFKLRSTDTDRNASGSTYVGFAWAESPFTTSNSK